MLYGFVWFLYNHDGYSYLNYQTLELQESGVKTQNLEQQKLRMKVATLILYPLDRGLRYKAYSRSWIVNTKRLRTQALQDQLSKVLTLQEAGRRQKITENPDILEGAKASSPK